MIEASKGESMNDTMQEAGLGVDAQDSKLASDFAELEAQKGRQTDRGVNWFFFALAVVVAVWAMVW